jgi:hypothetical protein
MPKPALGSLSDTVRRYARDLYLRPARQRRLATVAINVGEVHKALALRNRVPLVCMALKSTKFLEGNSLRLIAESGPPSGQSTTVTYTYEFVDIPQAQAAEGDAWRQLRGALKTVFADLGGGETYLGNERDRFDSRREGQ